jgi:benzylsuccinate CoA-transferase BbsF subunit
VVGQTLGFMGAEVYKIESRARIDLTRTLPPFAAAYATRTAASQSCVLGGNGSVTLNLKKPEALVLARELIAKCDVVSRTSAPASCEGRARLRRSEEAQARHHPVLDAGGRALRAVEGRAHLRAQPHEPHGTRQPDGYTGGGPIPVENAFSDPLNGIMGAFAILTALHVPRPHRDGPAHRLLAAGSGHADGRPAYMDYALNGRVAGTRGNRHPLDAALRTACSAARATTAGSASRSSPTTNGKASSRRWEAHRGPPSRSTRRGARASSNIELLHERIGSGRRSTTTTSSLGACKSTAWPRPRLNIADLLHDPHYRARAHVRRGHAPARLPEDDLRRVREDERL